MSRPQAPLRSWATAGAFHPPVTGARALLTRSGIHRMCDCVSTRQLASSTQRESRWKGVLEASGDAVTLESCSTSSINSSTQIGTELLTFDEFETRWSLQCYVNVTSHTIIRVWRHRDASCTSETHVRSSRCVWLSCSSNPVLFARRFSLSLRSSFRTSSSSSMRWLLWRKKTTKYLRFSLENNEQ